MKRSLKLGILLFLLALYLFVFVGCDEASSEDGSSNIEVECDYTIDYEDFIPIDREFEVPNKGTDYDESDFDFCSRRLTYPHSFSMTTDHFDLFEKIEGCIVRDDGKSWDCHIAVIGGVSGETDLEMESWESIIGDGFNNGHIDIGYCSEEFINFYIQIAPAPFIDGKIDGTEAGEFSRFIAENPETYSVLSNDINSAFNYDDYQVDHIEEYGDYTISREKSFRSQEFDVSSPVTGIGSDCWSFDCYWELLDISYERTDIWFYPSNRLDTLTIALFSNNGRSSTPICSTKINFDGSVSFDYSDGLYPSYFSYGEVMEVRYRLTNLNGSNLCGLGLWELTTQYTCEFGSSPLPEDDHPTLLTTQLPIGSSYSYIEWIDPTAPSIYESCYTGTYEKRLRSLYCSHLS